MKNINENQTFGNFRIERENVFAVAALKSIIDQDAIYNMIYIYGDVGAGKTHLLNATINKISKTKQSRIAFYSAKYLTCEIVEKFMSQDFEYILIDDMNLLPKNDALEEQLVLLIESNSKQLIFTSNVSPENLKVSSRLQKRLQWGLTLEILTSDEHIHLVGKEKGKCKSSYRQRLTAFKKRFTEEELWRYRASFVVLNEDLSNPDQLSRVLINVVFDNGSIEKQVLDFLIKEFEHYQGKKISYLEGKEKKKGLAEITNIIDECEVLFLLDAPTLLFPFSRQEQEQIVDRIEAAIIDGKSIVVTGEEPVLNYRFIREAYRFVGF